MQTDVTGSCCFLPCVQWCANGTTPKFWDLQCIVGRIYWRPCVIGVFGYMAPTMLERAVQTDPTLLRYASAITEQKKSWESLGLKFGRFQTLLNNSQQNAKICSRVCKWTQHVISNNVASVCRGLKCKEDKKHAGRSDVIQC